jgi:type II secretory pathway pseudopilin PulG
MLSRSQQGFALFEIMLSLALIMGVAVNLLEVLLRLSQEAQLALQVSFALSTLASWQAINKTGQAAQCV